MRQFLSTTAQTRFAISRALAEGVRAADNTPAGRQLRRDVAFVRTQESAEEQIAADPPERYTCR